MKEDQAVTSDAFTARILTFLEENCEGSYTVKELARALFTMSSRQKLQESMNILVRKGLVRVKSSGGEIAYQVVLTKQKTPPADSAS